MKEKEARLLKGPVYLLDKILYISLHFASFVSFRLVTNLSPPKLRNRELYSP